MREYIIKIKEEKDDFGNDCKIAEIQFDKNVLRNGAEHCKHFFIAYQTEEELDKILSEFSIEKEIENATEEIE